MHRQPSGAVRPLRRPATPSAGPTAEQQVQAQAADYSRLAAPGFARSLSATVAAAALAPPADSHQAKHR